MADSAMKAEQSADAILIQMGIPRFDLALTLGSGWGAAVDLIGDRVKTLSAADIPGFPVSSIEGHSGTLSAVRTSSGKNILVIGARTHLYEGKGPQAVAHSVRTAAACGVEVFILTNGAGGMKDGWNPGQPVLISDHINLTGTSPLEGPSFVDLTDLYSKTLRDVARKVEPTLDEGVYVQFRGPHYETPAEVRMARVMGGDMVGMSTALEAIAARDAGMEVLGLSLITNLASGISPNPLSHQEVIDVGKSAEPIISRLLANLVHAL